MYGISKLCTIHPTTQEKKKKRKSLETNKGRGVW